jgi:hypothetical protein
MFSIASIIFLVICIPLFMVGPIILQVFLSKRDNKFVGLIIPIIQFVLSLVIVLIFSVNAVAFVSYESDENTSVSYSEVYDDTIDSEYDDATISESLDDEYDEYDEYDDADVDETLDYGDDEVGSSTGISVLPSIIILFILTNIPTTISLIIYFVNRKGKPKKKQLDKINIQDLG